jgi:hypothetical protein
MKDVKISKDHFSKEERIVKMHRNSNIKQQVSNMRTLKWNCYQFLGIAMFFLFIQCNSKTVLNSSWQKDKINIDGKLSDWNGLIKQTPDREFGIGIANDDSSLFVCLTSDDRRIIHQVMRSGMTMWFENGKSKHNRLGIRFPMGMAGSDMNFRRFRETQDNNDSVRQIMQETLNTMEILGPEKTDTVPMRTTIAESFGIQMKVSPERGCFLYELKVPLHPTDSTSKYFVSADKNSLITIILESSSAENVEGSMDHTGQHMRGNMEMAGGNQSGFGSGNDAFAGGRHRAMGARGYHRSGNHEPPEPFSVEFCVKLANSK